VVHFTLVIKSAMPAMTKEKTFVARTVYHHRQRTSEIVTLLSYRDNRDGTYELWDNREAEHDYVCGTRDYVFDEWGARNRQLAHDGFQLDNVMGDNEWQRFIS
jgi:hypothetical protein